MSAETILLVLAKAPHPGQVKTRLCPPATPHQAAEIAAAALLDTLATVSAAPNLVAVVALAGDLTGAVREQEIRHAVRELPVLSQRGESLGERIAAAHADAATAVPGRPILQIGMDTPQITTEMLEACRAKLNSTGTDAVLGLATDGGWWILGLRDPLDAQAIADVPTSRDDTGRRTARALRGHGLRVDAVPVLSDVDIAVDARSVAAATPGSRFAAAVSVLS
jgi:uncharacterized protein